jgi:hypothetical protein
MSISLGGYLLCGLLISVQATARPEYSARYNIISCTVCHFSPVGGGPKKLNGKLFGVRFFKPSPSLIQDKVSGDFRALFYLPENSRTASSGMGVMSGSVAAHVPLDDKKKIELVLEHNIAGFSAAPYRDSYVLFHFSKENEYSWLGSLLVGRFRPPFGIITDDHRTYTRIQTATQWFTNETGVLLSSTPSETVHMDLAVTNGFGSSGQSLNAGQANLWGGVFNIRYMPSAFYVGASARFGAISQSRTANAWSLYTVLSLARWTQEEIPLTLKLEYVQAQKFNPLLARGYASDNNYVNSLTDSTSRGIYLQADWWLTNRLTLIYKFDYLMPDTTYNADFYLRNGVGLRWSAAAFTYLEARAELARATHPSENSKSGSLSRNAGFIILGVSL